MKLKFSKVLGYITLTYSTHRKFYSIGCGAFWKFRANDSGSSRAILLGPLMAGYGYKNTFAVRADGIKTVNIL